VNSTFAGHYDLAIYLMMNISLFAGLIFYFVDNPKFKTLRQKLTLSAVFLGLAALSFVVLVMTAARLSFIGVFLAIFLALILLKKWKFILVMFVFAIATLIYPSQLRSRLISTFTVNLASTWKSYTAISEEQAQRSNLNIPTLPSSGRGQDAPGLVSPDIAPGEPVDITDLGVYRSFSIRIYAEWPRAFRAFIKNPLLGTGYSSIGLATDNDVLRSLGEVGLLGTAAFALIIWELIKRVVVNVKKGRKFNKYFSVGVLAMIAAFLVNSLFIDVFEATKVASMFWLINGVYLGYNRRKV
jgi:O-antigen ligase